MLTPLDDDPNSVLFVITPPAILVRLGLVRPDERRVLTRAMYELRQPPRLWSVHRDKTVKTLRVVLDDRSGPSVRASLSLTCGFCMRSTTAEP